jgi:Undecaprenyl-phosphate galactose phosphotransferase WbaP
MQNESQVSDGRLIAATAGKSGLTDFDSSDHGRSSRESSAWRDNALPATLLRYRILKRAMDILVIVLSLPVLLPVIFLVAIMVRLTSPGPVFFSHRRICRDGAFFSMWKFRTMCVNSSDVLEQYLAKHPKARMEWKKTHKLRVDPRITSVGLFLRRTSLDELPQIWNVLRGQMSLVGPRPIVAAEVEKYAERFDHYCRVKPGVTGLWQVSGRSELTYADRVALDCQYVERWSLWSDVKILLRTCRSVMNRDGAY